eukprot:g11524.t1 g11524   contig57:9464-10532(-)
MKIRAAVETCVLGEAGKSVSEEESVSKVSVLKDMLAKKYGEIMFSLNPRLFETAELREDMCTKRLGGRPGKTNKDTTYGAKKMWASWTKMKTEMKKIFTRLPANYHKMKSGTQLYDVYDNLIRDHWREAFPDEVKDKTDLEIDEMISHSPMFWLEDCEYILAVMVHRNSGEWTQNCTERCPGPTRDTIRKNGSQRKVQRKVVNRGEESFLSEDSFARIDARELNPSDKEAMAKETILRSKKKRERQSVKNEEIKTKNEERTIKNTERKLKMLEKMKNEYVKHNGEDAYQEKRMKLLQILIDAGDEKDDDKSKTAGTDDDDEDEAGEKNNSD